MLYLLSQEAHLASKATSLYLRTPPSTQGSKRFFIYYHRSILSGLRAKIIIGGVWYSQIYSQSRRPLLPLAWDFCYINPNSHFLLVTTTGRVTYQSCYLRSETYRRNMAANRIVVSEFGTGAYPDPCKTIFQR